MSGKFHLAIAVLGLCIGAILFRPEPRVAGTEVSDQEASQINGGCVDVDTRKFCGNNTECEASNKNQVIGTNGISKVVTRQNCSTASCGTYVTHVDPCGS